MNLKCLITVKHRITASISELMEWLGFIFRNKADVEKISKSQWLWDSSFFVLRLWMPLFDPNDVGLDANLVWIKLPSVSLEWWSPEGLKAIGDRLDNTLAIDESYKTNSRRTMARVLVNLKIKDGLFYSIDLVCGTCKLSQTLDYTNNPFRCIWCHKVGHLLEECTIKKIKKKWVPKGTKIGVLQSDGVEEKLTVQQLENLDLCIGIEKAHVVIESSTPPSNSRLEDWSLKYMEEWRAMCEDSSHNKGCIGWTLVDNCTCEESKCSYRKIQESFSSKISMDSLLPSKNSDNSRENYVDEAEGCFVLDGNFPYPSITSPMRITKDLDSPDNNFSQDLGGEFVIGKVPITFGKSTIKLKGKNHLQKIQSHYLT
jgi:hypothetical protein